MIVPKYVVDQNIINAELQELEIVLNQQKHLKKVLLIYLEKISEGLYDLKNPQDTNSIISYLKSIQHSFENIKENINKLMGLKKYLENILTSNSFTSFDFANYNNTYNQLFSKIAEDNIAYYTIMEKLLKFMKIDCPDINHKETNQIQVTINDKKENTDTSINNEIPKIIKSNNSTFQNNQKTAEPSENIIFPDSESNKLESSSSLAESKNSVLENFESNNNTEKNISSKDINKSASDLKDTQKTNLEEIEKNPKQFIKISEKTLVFCEDKQIAILPYSRIELEEFFSSNPEKYSSIQDIIDKEYTISLKNYKLRSFSRFRETFNLLKNKSDSSLFKALQYSNKMLLNTKLHPAIITACKNIDELQDYLTHINSNNENEFDCFKIVHI